MHENIRRFSHDGLLAEDVDRMRIKDVMTRTLKQEMQEQGYVPVLDINPQWSNDYEPEHKRFSFTITMYGVYVGKRKACLIEGVSNGKLHKTK